MLAILNFQDKMKQKAFPKKQKLAHGKICCSYITLSSITRAFRFTFSVTLNIFSCHTKHKSHKTRNFIALLCTIFFFCQSSSKHKMQVINEATLYDKHMNSVNKFSTNLCCMFCCIYFPLIFISFFFSLPQKQI